MTGAELVEDAIAELREEPLQVPFVSHFPTSDTSAHLDGWLLALVRQQRVELAGLDPDDYVGVRVDEVRWRLDDDGRRAEELRRTTVLEVDL